MTNDIAKDNAGNSMKIDVNSDNEIQQSEALLVYRLLNLNYTSANTPDFYMNYIGITPTFKF